MLIQVNKNKISVREKYKKIQILSYLFIVISKLFVRHSQTEFHFSEAAARMYSIKMAFLKISKNLQENTCARVSFLSKFVGVNPASLLKKESIF